MNDETALLKKKKINKKPTKYFTGALGGSTRSSRRNGGAGQWRSRIRRRRRRRRRASEGVATPPFLSFGRNARRRGDEIRRLDWRPAAVVGVGVYGGRRRDAAYLPARRGSLRPLAACPPFSITIATQPAPSSSSTFSFFFLFLLFFLSFFLPFLFFGCRRLPIPLPPTFSLLAPIFFLNV